MSKQPQEDPIVRMAFEEVQALVASLEEKYRTMVLLTPLSGTPPSPRQLLTLADLAKIRASLQRSVAHLDKLLVAWDAREG